MISNKDRSKYWGASETSKIVGNWDTKTFMELYLVKLGVAENNFTKCSGFVTMHKIKTGSIYYSRSILHKPTSVFHQYSHIHYASFNYNLQVKAQKNEIFINFRQNRRILLNYIENIGCFCYTVSCRTVALFFCFATF